MWPHWTLRHFIGTLTEFSVICSILHSILPPWDSPFLDGFPKAQKVYKSFIYLLGYLAVNVRSTVHRDISTDNGTRPSTVAIKEKNGINGGNGH
jgi:hypothetical protein